MSKESSGCRIPGYLSIWEAADYLGISEAEFRSQYLCKAVTFQWFGNYQCVPEKQVLKLAK